MGPVERSGGRAAAGLGQRGETVCSELVEGPLLRLFRPNGCHWYGDGRCCCWMLAHVGGKRPALSLSKGPLPCQAAGWLLLCCTG